jgi:hypothetical protein
MVLAKIGIIIGFWDNGKACIKRICTGDGKSDYLGYFIPNIEIILYEPKIKYKIY